MLETAVQNQLFLKAKMQGALAASPMQGPTGPTGPTGATGPAGGPVGATGPAGPTETIIYAQRFRQLFRRFRRAPFGYSLCTLQYGGTGLHN